MQRWRGLFFIFALSMILVGCGSDPGFNEATDFARKEGGAQFVNMIPDSPELSMFHGLNNDTVGYSFATGAQIRFEDRYDWRIAYRASNLDEVTVAEADDQQVLENTLSTFLFMGSMAQPDIQIVDIPFPPTNERTEGVATIWFAANVSSIAMADIYFLDSSDSFADATPLTSVNSGGFTTTFDVTPTETARLIITAAGATDILFDSGEIPIPDQSIQLFALIDDFGPDAANHVDVIRDNAASRSILPDRSQSALTRINNYTTVADVAVNVGTTAFTDLSQAELTSYEVTPSGDQSITVVSGADTLIEDTAQFVAGRHHTLLTFDRDGEEPPIASVVIQDQFRTVTDRALFQFVNGSTETIDFYSLVQDQDFDDVGPLINDAQNIATGIVEVPLGQTRFHVRSADNTQTLSSADLNLVSGVTYTLIYEANGGLQVIQD